MEPTEKPVKAKPQFYAVCLHELQVMARLKGYNLLVHGSMNRDFDLIAVPWVDDCCSHMELLTDFCEFLGANADNDIMPGSPLGGGRIAYVINLNRGGKWNKYVDEKYYLDISFTPKIPNNPAQEK